MAATSKATVSGQRPTAKAPSERNKRRLVQQIVSSWRTQAIHVAAQLQVADYLAQGPMDADDLAKALCCSADGLARLLRALCALGLCRETVSGHFSLTPTGQLLRSEGSTDQTSLRSLALWWGGATWPMWGELGYSVRTGGSAREHLTGDAYYGYLHKSAESASIFHDAMSAMTALIVADVARHDTWHSANRVVDVGGGHGEVAVGILAAHPHLYATVFDLPHAQTGAQARTAAAGLSDNCEFQSGSFFDSLPQGADRYLLKSILHNWNDERCAAILASCKNAMKPGARLLLVERVRPARLHANTHDEALARTDLNMLAGLGGRERTQDEFIALLRPAGFVVLGIWRTSFEFTVIEAGSI